MSRPWKWLLLLVAFPAVGQTPIPCTVGCPAVAYFEAQPCAAGTCARSYAPLPTEFSAAGGNKGLSLSSLAEGVAFGVCAAPGFKLQGTGTLRVWTWAPWLPNDVSSDAAQTLDVATADVGSECSYTTLSDGGVVSGVGAGDGGANITYRCRCVHWADRKVGGYSSRKVIAQAVGITVDGGTALEVRIVRLETIR